MRDRTDDPQAPVFHTLGRGRKSLGQIRLAPSGVYRALKRYLPKHSPHGLRATALTATYLAANGNIEMARLVARHASEKTTRRYVHADLTAQAYSFAPEFG